MLGIESGDVMAEVELMGACGYHGCFFWREESEGDGAGGKPSVCGIFQLKDRPLMLLL